MKQHEFDRMIEIVENAYHLADEEYKLPHKGTYGHVFDKDKPWSCPMRPDDISDLLHNEFYDKIEDEPTGKYVGDCYGCGAPIYRNDL